MKVLTQWRKGKIIWNNFFSHENVKIASSLNKYYFFSKYFSLGDFVFLYVFSPFHPVRLCLGFKLFKLFFFPLIVSWIYHLSSSCSGLQWVCQVGSLAISCVWNTFSIGSFLLIPSFCQPKEPVKRNNVHVFTVHISRMGFLFFFVFNQLKIFFKLIAVGREWWHFPSLTDFPLVLLLFQSSKA